MIGGATRVYALLGHPVARSRSPALYNAWFEHDGRDAVYVALDVPPTPGDRLATAIRTLGLAGVNLTVPHKSALVPHLDAADPDVVAAGAVNVVLVEDGRLVGHNTDGEGFCRAWEESFGPVPAGRAIVLGAGGAARAVAAALAGRGVAEVVLLNRGIARAEEAAAHLARHAPATSFRVGPLDPAGFAAVAGEAALVVSAAAGEARSVVASLDPGRLPAGAAWVDLNYWDPDPPGLSACRARGLRTQDGLGMLIQQAALAYRHFTGRMPDPVLLQSRLG